MKTKMVQLAVLVMLTAFSACAPQIHLDFLGRDSLQETVLVPSSAKEKILAIHVSGVIASIDSPGLFDKEGDIVSRIYTRLQLAEKDPAIKGIVLMLDTPGGEVTASDIIYHEILRFKESSNKPVVALMMGVAASGGYYIASACDYIVAHPSTITGSIGVIAMFPELNKLMEKVGVSVNVVKSGEMKDAGSPFKTMTRDDRDVFQGMIDEMYTNFLTVVYKNRKNTLSMEQLKILADGRIYTAKQALDHKLVDAVGYFDEALDKTLDLASLKRAKVVTYTFFPNRKTNIYAMSTTQSNPFANPHLYEKIIPSLKPGFYYLWLPKTTQ